MPRLTDDEKRIGPLRCGTTSWRAWRFTIESHGGDEGYKWNTLTAYFFGFVVSLYLPRIIQPQRRKVQAVYWNADTIARMGRDWYWDEEPREYGFCLSEGHFILYYGIQPGDSSRDQHWSCFLPWTQWRFMRFSLYQPDGTHFYTQHEAVRRLGSGMDLFREQQDAEERVGKIVFQIQDFDGEIIAATTHIQEREWHFGTKWYSWLSWFRKPKILRSLDIRFSSEVGRDKGSWKGGTIGHSITMLAGETPTQAFRRYCEQEHRSKNGPYRIQFMQQPVGA